MDNSGFVSCTRKHVSSARHGDGCLVLRGVDPARGTTSRCADGRCLSAGEDAGGGRRACDHRHPALVQRRQTPQRQTARSQEFGPSFGLGLETE